MRLLICSIVAVCVVALFVLEAEGQPRRPNPGGLPLPPSKTPQPEPDGGGWDPARDAYKDLLGKTRAAVVKLVPGRTRVAVFAFGDSKGGSPEALKPQLTELTAQFLDSLTQAAGDKFSVLGPDGIANELAANGRKAADAADLDPSKPEQVADWMRKNLPEDIRVVILGRLTEENKPILTLVSRDGKVETVSAATWFGSPGRPAPQIHAESRCLVTPTLFLRVSGNDRKYPVPLYAEKNWEYALAVIPDDLLKALDAGDLRLEIELKKTDNQPSKVTVGSEVFALAKDTDRLFCNAVSIDMRETIADKIVDQKTGKERSAGYRILPQSQQRKWVLTYPGRVVEATQSGSPVVKAVQGVGHSIRPVLGFQADDCTAELFTVRRPSDGAAPATGITSSPGLIRVTVYAEKKTGDKKEPYAITGSGSPGTVQGVSIQPKERVNHPVVALKVNCYPTPLEEHVILLCTKVQHDPDKEKLVPYPPAPVTP